MSAEKPLIEGVDYYVDPQGLWVFTETYLKARGFCCHQGCRHCPYTRQRASVLCVHEGKLLVVKLREPKTGVIRPYPPGGGIEPDETPERAAERETWEETGYRVRILPGSEVVRRYLYRWDGINVDVTTHFFRAELKDSKAAPDPTDPPEGDVVTGVEWIAVGDLSAALSTDTVMGPILLELLIVED